MGNVGEGAKNCRICFILSTLKKDPIYNLKCSNTNFTPAEPQELYKDNKFRYILYIFSFPVNTNENSVSFQYDSFSCQAIRIDTERDNFIFNLSFNGTFEQNIMTLYDQYISLYKQVNKLNNEDAKNIIKIYLLKDTINVFNDDKFDLLLYLTLINDTKDDNLIYSVLRKFSITSIKIIPDIKKDLIDETTQIIKNQLLNQNFIEKYNDNNSLDLQEKIYEFSIFFVLHFSIENLDYILEKINIKKCIQILINEHSKDIKLNKEIISKFLPYCDKNNLLDILKKAKTINDLLSIVIENEKIITKLQITIIINDFCIVKKEDNIQLLFQNLKTIQNMESLNKNIKLEDINFLDNYITFFDEEDLQKLYLIQQLCEEYKEQLTCSFDNILNQLRSSIHITGIKFIEENKLNNNEVLNFISKDYFYSKRNKNDNDNKEIKIISKGLNLQEFNEDYIIKYKNIEFYNIFNRNQFEDFLKCLYKSIKTIPKLLELFKLHPLETNFENKDIVIECIKERFVGLLELERNLKHIEQIKEIVRFLLNNYDKNEKQKFFELLKKKAMNDDICYNIFISIINDMDLSSLIIDYLLNKKKRNPFDLIKLVKQKEVLSIIFQNINEYSITEDDFYSEKRTENLGIYINLDRNNYFNDEYIYLHKINYFTKTSEKLNSLRKKIEELHLKEFELKDLMKLSNEELLERLTLIFSHNQDKANQMKEKLIKANDSIIALRDNINSIIDYESFFNLKGENLQKLQKFNNNLNSVEICDIYQNEDMINYINITKVDASSFNQKLKSQFFTSIINDLKYKSPNTREENIKKANEKFSSLEQMFDQQKINNISKDLFNLIFEDIKDIDKEIEFLKKYFKKENVDTKYLEDRLYITANKDNIKSIINSLLKIIECFNIKKTNYSNTFLEISNLLKESFVNAITIKEKCNEIGYNYKDKTKLVSIIEILNRKDNFLPFLMNKKGEEVRYLIDFIDEDIDGEFLKKGDIEDLVKPIDFINDLQSNSSKKDDRAFIEYIKKLSEDNKYKAIEIYLESVINNLSEFEELYSKAINKNEFSKKKIESLYTSSNYTIELKEGKVNCSIQYDGLVTITLEEVLELKDRILLKKRQQSSQDEKEYNDYSTFYSIKLNLIEQSINYLKQLSYIGYPNDIQFIIYISNYLNEVTEGNDTKKIRDKIKELKHKTENLIKEQKNAYEKYHLITFLNGRQFYTVNKYIKEKKGNINNILKYIFRSNNIKQDDNFNYNKIKDKEDENMLYNIHIYLKSLLEINNLTIEDIYSQSLIHKDKYQGIYTILTPLESLEEDIIKRYHYLTNNLPIAQTILYCNESTTSEELIAFLYRAMYCPFYILFSIVKIELLDLKKRYMILDIINTFFIEKKGEMKSCLMLYFTNRNSDIIDQLAKGNYHKFLDREIIKEKHKLDKENIEVVSAEASGLGKSNYIKEYAKEKKLEYIFFPIGGDFTREEISIRLSKIDLINNNILLHIDLLDTNKIDLMKDFLFNILILKYYSYQENIIYFTNNIIIKIEIPFGFFNYISIYPILSLFNQYIITKNAIPPLKVSQDITSNIQIVCSHLLYYSQNKINDTMLYFPGFSYEKEKEDEEEIEEIYFDFNFKKNKQNNYDDMKPLPSEQCINLIKKYVTLENSNYYQITSFINVLADQFRKFNRNIYLTVQQLKNIARGKGHFNLRGVREYLIYSLIEITKHFTKGAYTNLINSQKITYDAQEEDIENMQEQATEALINKEKVSFDQIKPSLIFFNEDGQSLSIISTCDEDTDEYEQLTNLYNSGKETNKDKLINYKKLTQEQFLLEIKKVLSINNEINYRKTVNKVELRSLKEIADSYVFTADNYIKMILILLRVRANIPVIMMGETGCGKTSLIRMIKELKNNDMIILNIHAGINDNDIINFITNNNLLDEQNNDLNKKYKDKVWVFLDEINTCNSMGLISEMMCNHTMQGKKISNQVVFIAACNPYRLITKKRIEVGLTKRKEAKVRNLVYSVNPLPFSLLNYVFDFGNLTKEDEEKYIERMITQSIKNNISNEYLNLAKKSVIKAQNYVRDLNDISSVSLREVRRFVILLEWFIQYLYTKKEIKNKIRKKYRQEMNQRDIIKRSIILSIILCYYLRLSDKNQRKEFREYLSPLLGDILKVSNEEMNEIADRVKLPPGIARNRALLENLFTLFVCINNKIPLFICGKPGCSKSLSVQLIYKAMKGKNSDDPLFQQLPKLYIKSYQGSLTSTSKGILKVFDKARNIVRSANKDEVISMFYFDEIGLAEISKNNPLKVIHSQLEYDDNKDKIAFVGISNWTLDASKMNRGIFISILDQDEEDLIKTAETIANSYKDRISIKYNHLIESLAKTFYRYKNVISDKKEFHGARDFYHLIKNASIEIIKYKEQIEQRDIFKIGISSLERNFGGLPHSIKQIKQIFNKYYNEDKSPESYEVMKCIESNIVNELSRYLLVISKASLSPYLIKQILKKLNKDSTFYLGSQFKEDINQELYSLKILNRIQSSMEHENVLVLKNLESIYPSLYDLFNQNFTIVGNKSFARIALGSSNNVMSYVNDNFRCVILLDQSEIDKQDPPFLNRFEKHIISYKYLLNEECLNLSKNISNYLKDLAKPKNEKLKIKINLSKELLNCDLEEIQGIVYECKQKNKEINKIQLEVVKKLIPTFSQDIIAFSKISMLHKTHYDIIQTIIEEYNNINNTSINNFLKETSTMKNVIYTFSNILETITIKDNNITKTFGLLKKENIKEILIYSINSENELESEIEEFYSKDNLKLCILRFKPYDCIHLNHIEHFIDNIEKGREVKKMFIFLIHIQRFINSITISQEEKEEITIKNENLISHFSSYNQLFIDNINGDDIKLNTLLQMTNEQLINTLINVKKIINNNIYESFMNIKYTFKNKSKNCDINKYHNIISAALYNNEKVKDDILKCIIKAISKEKDNNYITKCFYDNLTSFDKNEGDFIGILRKYLTSIIKIFLCKFIFISEKEGGLNPILLGSLKTKEQVNKIWEEYINKTDLNKIDVTIRAEANNLEHVVDLNIPSSLANWNKVINYAEEIKDEYFEVDNEMRYIYTEKEDINERKIKYERVIAQKEQNILVEIEKQKGFKDIISLSDSEDKTLLMKEMFYDYLKIYLSKKHNIEPDALIQLIEYILELKFNSTVQYTLKEIPRYVIWLQCYSEQINKLCEIYIELSTFNHDLLKDLKEIQKQVTYETSKYNPKDKQIVNKPFYIVIESISLSIFSSKNLFDFKDINKLSYFIKTIGYISQYAFQLDINLQLFLNELYSLHNFISCYHLISHKGEEVQQRTKDLYLLFKKESQDKLKKKAQEIYKDFKEQFEFCEKHLKDLNEYPETMMSFFITKYKQNKDIEYRKQIFEKVLSKYQFIIKSKELLFIFFRPLSLTPQTENEDEEEEDIINSFLSFSQKKNEILSLLDKANNEVLNEILLFCFEGFILSYFEEEKKNKNENEQYLKGITLKYFEIACEFLKNKHFNALDKKYIYSNLAFLYSIAYIKIYLSYYVEYNIEEKGKTNFKDINDIIEKNYESTGKTIQLYTLKLFRTYFDNYEEFKKYSWSTYQMEWVDKFGFNDQAKTDLIKTNLDFLLISLKEKETFIKMSTLFEELLKGKFRNENEEFTTLLKDKGKNIFIDIIINRILSKLYDEYFFNGKQISRFSNWINDKLLLPNDNLFFQNTKTLLSLFSDSNKIKSKVFDNKKISLQKLEILLYSFKIVFNCSEADNDSFYQQLFSTNIEQIIKNNYIPGVEPNDALIIKSYYLIKQNEDKLKHDDEYIFFDDYDYDYDNSYGAYICSCGNFYEIGDCGFPWIEFNCNICGEKIGGENHSMVKREGHFRIVKDIKQKKYIEGLEDRYINCKLLDDLRKEVDELNKNEQKGIKQVKKGFFNESKEKIRGLSQISYRLLSFVLYSVIYYAKSVGYLNEETIKPYLCPNTTCFQMIETNWEILKKLLLNKQISHMQIFMNLIFDKLFEIIKHCPMLTTKELRKDFEEKVNLIVDEVIKNYIKNDREYIEINNKILGLSHMSLRVIIHELADPSVYGDDEIPFLKYFMLTTYPSSKHLENELNLIEDAISKYPMLVNYFKEKENNEKLQNLSFINPFSNIMMNKYSNNIEREDANKKKINKELQKMSVEENKFYPNFETAWGDISDQATQYKCHQLDDTHKLSKSDSIAYCLNDDDFQGYGMYLASIYELFIKYQNDILKSVLFSMKGNLISTDQITKEIYVQDATKSEIVSFDINEDRCLFSNFEQMLSVYAERNCFNDDYSINYSKYKEITYDYSKLNDELCKIFLPGTKIFKTEQKFVTYKYEFLNGSNSDILHKFATKYSQRKLEKKEKEIIYTKIKNLNESTDFLSSLQILIFYLQKENFPIQMSISEIISSLPQYIQIVQECKGYFETNDKLTIEILLEIYEYSEYLCFEKIKVHDEYNQKMNEESKKKVNEYYNKDNQHKLITKVILSSGVRKFISRYLSGIRNNAIVKSDANIFLYLPYKPDLWSKEIFDAPRFMEEFTEMEKLNIKVNEAMHLYQILGGDKELFMETQTNRNNENNRTRGNRRGRTRPMDY